MRNKFPLTLSLPYDVTCWLRREAARRRISHSDFGLDLLQRGIQSDSVDQAVARFNTALQGDPLMRQILEELILLRRILERQSAVEVVTGLQIDSLRSEALAELAHRWPLEREDGNFQAPPPGPNSRGRGRAP